jgi:hypothetical protein
MARKMIEARRVLQEGERILSEAEELRGARNQAPEVFDAWRRLNGVLVAEQWGSPRHWLGEARSAAGEMLDVHNGN